MLYEDYLKLVSTRLINDHFDLEGEVKIGKYRADLFAMSKVFTYPKDQLTGLNPFLGWADYRLTFEIIFTPAIMIEFIKDYSMVAYKFIYDKVSDSSIFHRFALPVLATQKCPEEVKGYVCSYDGINFRPPVADKIHPVLVELDTETIYHNTKVTMVHSRSKKIPIEAVKKYLIVGNMKKV